MIFWIFKILAPYITSSSEDDGLSSDKLYISPAVKLNKDSEI